MTAAWLPPDSVLSAWHRRFPNGPHPWAARLRLWRAELPVRPPDSPLAAWVARAGDAATGRLGLPAALVTAIRTGVRQGFAFLELPGGLYPIPAPADHFDEWPEPITSVPPEVLTPAGVEVLPRTGHWRTVPVVRAEMVRVMANRSGNGIDVYVVDEAGTLSEQPLATLPAAALPAG